MNTKLITKLTLSASLALALLGTKTFANTGSSQIRKTSPQAMSSEEAKSETLNEKAQAIHRSFFN